VLANRAGIRVHLGDLTGAAADYEEAAALFRSEGNEFVALNVISDLGCVAANLGDLPRALRLFDDAADGMSALGHDASAALLARADALLIAGLTADALTSATDAARRLDAAGSGLSAAKALLAAAQAARHEGETHAALDAAATAAATFVAGGADGWARAAGLEVLRARYELGLADADDLATAEQLASAFAAAGDVRGELNACCVAGTVAARLGETTAVASYLRRANDLATSTATVDASLAVHTAEAAALLNVGDPLAAGRAVDRALAAAEKHAVAGIATTTRHALGPVVAGLAATEPSARTALAWIERELATRSRAGGRRDPEDVERFARLRAVSADLQRAERDGSATDALRASQAAAERELRDAGLRRERAPRHLDAGTFDPGALCSALGEAAAVSLVLAGDAAFGLVAHDGGVRRVDLGPLAELRRSAHDAARALRGLSRWASAAAVAEARRRTFDAATAALDRLLQPALQLDAPHLVLTMPAELHTVPWSALTAMRERSFVIVPSLAWWTASARRAAPPAPTVAVIAGPRLEHAATEAGAVAACHPGATVLHGAEATAGATLRALATHDVVHLVAHGRFRHDNPRWSTIELADGPLPVDELDSLERVPSTVVIATCESATTGGRPGAPVEGIAHALLDRGARTVVASVGALPDSDATIAAMRSLHTALRDGVGAAEALAASRRHGVDVTAASLVTLGVGDR
jgi:tetratricopeptide (TPR) repeat protein